MGTEGVRPSPLKPIFLTAMQIEDPGARQAYLEQVCINDEESRRTIERLLAARDRTSTLFDQAIELMQTGWMSEDAGSGFEPMNVALGASVGPYKLLERIGEGGMGVVFMAQQTEPLKRQVALKIIKPGMDSRQVIARFEAERQVLALMQHPNIARVLDAGTTKQGHPFFVMELVMGEPLTMFCQRRKLTLIDCLRLFDGVCRGVQHAHQKGVIHRDLKPSNVLVTMRDGKPMAKVIDFGIAKAVNPDLTGQSLLTRHAQLLGTPLYMSPEQTQLTAQGVDTRSDVYSLGVLLYELLTGVTPFDRDLLSGLGVDELRRMICDVEPPRPSDRVNTLALSDRPPSEVRRLRLALRGELNWIVMRAIEKEPDRRYESAGDLAADVERYLRNDPVQACPPSVSYRLRKLARRNKGLLLATAVVMVSLLAGAGVSAWQAVTAIGARQLADQRYETARRAEARATADNLRFQELLYVSDMKLSSESLRARDFARATTLLQRHLPQAGERDWRGFEWYYLKKRVSVNPHWRIDLGGSPVRGIHGSPSSQEIAVSTRDGRIRVVETASGEVVQTLISPVEINGLGWGPEGRRIASAGADGRIRIWAIVPRSDASETTNGDLMPDVLSATDSASSSPTALWKAHDGEVNAVLFGPDDTIISCGDDDLIRTWKAETRQELTTLQGHQREVEAVSLLPDGTRLLSASSDDSIGIWDLKRGVRTNIWTSPSNAGRVVSAASSLNGSLVAAGDINGNLIAVNVKTAELHHAQLVDGIESVAFLNGSNRIAVGDRGGAIQLWSLSQDAGGAIALQNDDHWIGHADRVVALVAMNSGEFIISGSRNGQVAFWSTKSRSKPDAISGILDFDLGYDDSLFLTDQREVLQYDIQNQRPAQTMLPNASNWTDLAAATASPRIAVVDASNVLVVYDVRKRLEIMRRSLFHAPKCVAISPDGRLVALSFWDAAEHVSLIDVANGSEPTQLTARTCGAVAFSPDGRMLGVGDLDDLLVYVVQTDGPPQRLIGHNSTLSGVAFHPDGETVATVSHDRCLKLWKLTTGELTGSCQAHLDDADSVTFSNDGRVLATAGRDGAVRLWHTGTMQPLLDIDGQQARTKVRFASSGRRLCVMREDDTTLIYDTLSQAPH